MRIHWKELLGSWLCSEWWLNVQYLILQTAFPHITSMFLVSSEVAFPSYNVALGFWGAYCSYTRHGRATFGYDSFPHRKIIRSNNRTVFWCRFITFAFVGVIMDIVFCSINREKYFIKILYVHCFTIPFDRLWYQYIHIFVDNAHLLLVHKGDDPSCLLKFTSFINFISVPQVYSLYYASLFFSSIGGAHSLETNLNESAYDSLGTQIFL